MINENVGMVKDYANAKAIADIEEAQASFMEARAETQSQRDKILWELESCGGNMPRSTIARHTKLKQPELDSILEELERENIIKRTRLRTDHNGPPRELISLKV
jgi:DNA-binding MarR family transcriptional regulator